jgi:hypothetical protein
MASKGKDKDDAGDQKTSSYTGDTKKVEAKDEPFKPTNESAYASRSNMTPMQGVGDATNDPLPKPKPAPAPKVIKSVSEPSDKSVKLAPENRDLEANMSRGTRTPANPASTVSSSEEGMKNYKPRRTPAASTSSSSAEGMKNYKPRRTPAASTSSSSAEGMKNYKPRRAPAAAPFKGGQPGYDEAGNFLGGRRGYDEAGNPMKKGGKVKKMASGGMTVSKRADGIASRGKTKCKMY